MQEHQGRLVEGASGSDPPAEQILRDCKASNDGPEVPGTRH